MKAIALISGGLDSLLAARLIKEQGIEVIGLHYRLPFCQSRPADYLFGTGIRLEEADLCEDFLALLKKPRYGFGSHMNPCIDCKILMLRRIRDFLSRFEASFVVTGEVLGQRPMSQNRRALEVILRDCGLGELLLRPLSARLFPPTLPEREGWVDRRKLLDFNGRMRSPQIQLAAALGIKKYSTPAGGCLLTDRQFSGRLKELIGHNELDRENLELLKLGRHFRLRENAKLVVGRNERENSRLTELAGEGDYLFYPGPELAGPTCLGRGLFDPELIALSCRLAASYSDLKEGEEADIFYRCLPGEEEKKKYASAVSREDFLRLRI